MNSNKEYDKIYEGYKENLPSPKISKRYFRLLSPVSQPQLNKKLLDVGCGCGMFLKEVEKFGLETYGIDPSETAIELSKKNCKANLKIANGEEIPYPENFFDYVTSLGCLEHYDNTEKGIRELARVLKKDGTASIYVPNTFFIRDIFHVLFKGDIKPTTQKVNKTQTKDGWRKLIEKNGLKVVSIKRNNIFGSLRLNRKIIRKIIYILLQWLIPFNFSYSFIFLCKKEGI